MGTFLNPCNQCSSLSSEALTNGDKEEKVLGSPTLSCAHGICHLVQCGSQAHIEGDPSFPTRISGPRTYGTT